MHVFLRDAAGPDERGEPTHVPLEHALVQREVQVLAAQDDRVLVVVVDDAADRGRVSVDVVRVVVLMLLLLLQRRGSGSFLDDLVGPEMVPGTVRDGPIRGVVARVHYVLIFVWFVVVLSDGAYLLTRHGGRRALTG